LHNTKLAGSSEVRAFTEVLRGGEQTTQRVVSFFSNAQRVDACADSMAPSIAMGVDPIRKSYEDLKRRGVRVRWLTEITKENLGYCKALMQYAELRHLDGIKGNFGVSDREYIGTAYVSEEAEPVPELIYSSVPSIIEQNRYLFETLWSRAVAAEDRIREIESGAIRPETISVKDPQAILASTIKMVQRSAKYSVCSVPEGLLYAYNFSLEVFSQVLAQSRLGAHRGIRWVTQIDGSSLDVMRVAKAFLALGMQIRHVDSITPMSFGVSDKEMGVTVEKLQGGVLNTSAIFSSEPVFVSHFSEIFEGLWARGVDAKDRIRELEDHERTFIDVIVDPKDIERRYRLLVDSAKERILLYLPTTTAYVREEKIGIFKSLQNASSRGVAIQMLVPADSQIEQKIRNEIDSNSRFEIRKIRATFQAEARTKILIVDSKTYLMVELKDDSKETFAEAVGSAIISNSRSTVLSYATLFQSLWDQADLYEKLEAHDKMQREFINIAAHELRTPTQVILGYAELLHNSTAAESQSMIEALARNAYRLQGLITDVLDVARIEAGALNLKKEYVDLNQLLAVSIREFEDQVRTSGKTVKVTYVNKSPASESKSAKLGVYADRERLMQLLTNLLGNALKFTEQGTISVSAERAGKFALVKVVDSGSGIHPQVLSSLFEKFVTKSEKGTGLGLFISKSIVEAHGGRIWSESNQNGATFMFTLPVGTS